MSFTTPCFHLPSQSFLLHHRTGQYSLTEHSSSLALGPGHGLIALFLCAVKQTNREKGEEMYERNYEQAGRRLWGKCLLTITEFRVKTVVVIVTLSG